MAMTDAELGQWVLRRLGAPMVKVELTKEHLEDAIEAAKRWFAAKKGILTAITVPVVGGEIDLDAPPFLFHSDWGDRLPARMPKATRVLQTVYGTTISTPASAVAALQQVYGFPLSFEGPLMAFHADSRFPDVFDTLVTPGNPLLQGEAAPYIEAEPESDVDRVSEVVFSGSGAGSTLDMAMAANGTWILPGQQGAPAAYFGGSGLSRGATGGLFSGYMQWMQYLEMAKRVMGADQGWSQEGRKLYLYPTPTVATAIITYTSHTMDRLDIATMSERNSDLIKRYALAKAKLDLGRVRSKYGELPTAQGTTSLDGERLLEEGKEEIEALEEEIGQSGYPLGVVIG